MKLHFFWFRIISTYCNLTLSAPTSQQSYTPPVFETEMDILQNCVSPETGILRDEKFFNINHNLKGIVKKDLHYVILCFVRYWRKKEVWVYSENTCIGCLDLVGEERGELAKIQTKSSFSSQIDFRFKDNQEKRPILP